MRFKDAFSSKALLTNDHLNISDDWTDEKFDMKMTYFFHIFFFFQLKWIFLSLCNSNKAFPMTTKIATNIKFQFEFDYHRNGHWGKIILFKRIKLQIMVISLRWEFFQDSKRVKLLHFHFAKWIRNKQKSKELFYYYESNSRQVRGESSIAL